MYIREMSKNEQKKIAQILLKKGIHGKRLKKLFTKQFKEIERYFKEEDKWDIFTA